MDVSNHQFECCQFVGGRLIWINTAHHLFLNKDDLLDKCCWAIKGNECFDELLFTNKSIFLTGERYGGRGIGRNGGGVRVGNIGNYQIKGVGNNGLAGFGVPRLHMYGGLSLKEALFEVIASIIYSSILPYGSLPCIAIIKTGNATAYEANESDHPERVPGALLVRERTLRPAHFLRAVMYTHSKKCVKEDVDRVKSIIYQLRVRTQNITDVIGLIERFVDRSATQFGVARNRRIVHGAMGPSNICLDGKWLDLATCTFYEDVEEDDYRGARRNILSEADAPYEIARELINNINRFSNSFINSQHLLDFYKDSVGAAIISSAHIPFSLACSDEIELFRRSNVGHVMQRLIALDAHRTDRVANLCSSYISKFAWSIVQNISYAQSNMFGNVDSEALIAFSRNLAGHLKKNGVRNNHKAIALKCVRQERYRSLFSRGQILRNISYIIGSDNDAELSNLILNYQDALWVFSNDVEEIILFRSNFHTIKYFAPDNVISYKNMRYHSDEFVVSSHGDIEAIINSSEPTEWRLCGVDCRKYIVELTTLALGGNYEQKKR